MIELIVVLFFVIVGGCYLIFKKAGNALFPDEKPMGYVDNSVHHHHYHYTQQNLTIIEDKEKPTTK